MNRHSLDEYRTLIQASGLEVISIVDKKEMDVFKNKNGVIKHLKSWLPHYHFLKEQNELLAESFVSSIVDRYVEQYPPDESGNIVLIDHNIEAIAEKRR